MKNERRRAAATGCCGLLTLIGGRLFLLAVNGVLFYRFYTRGSREKKMKKVRY